MDGHTITETVAVDVEVDSAEAVGVRAVRKAASVAVEAALVALSRGTDTISRDQAMATKEATCVARTLLGFHTVRAPQ